jgi:hypothetical protein
VAIHGLDADQVLLSPFFALSTTRTGTRARRLRELRDQARSGNRDAALQVMRELTKGSEASDLANPIAVEGDDAPLAAPLEPPMLRRGKRSRAKSKRRNKARARK